MRNRGFTLIEMLISVAVFSMVMVVALGALLSLSEANRKAELLSEATNNFNSAIDSMSRSIRTGSQYHGGCNGGSLKTPQDCQSVPATLFAYLPNGATLDTQIVSYQYSNDPGQCGGVAGCILRSVDDGAHYASITSPDIVITSLKFFVVGAPEGLQSFGSLIISVQPKVTVLINGYVTVKGGEKTDFKVQTSITQRLYDQ